MYSKVVTIALLGFGLKCFLSYRDWLDWDKNQVFSIKPGSCKTFIQDGGAEDVTHIGNGIVLMSTGLRFFGPPGQIKALDLKNENKLVTLDMTDTPTRSDFLSGAHGITTWRDPDIAKSPFLVDSFPVVYKYDRTDNDHEKVLVEVNLIESTPN